MREIGRDRLESYSESNLITILEERLQFENDRIDADMAYVYEDLPLPITEHRERMLLEDRSNHSMELEMYFEVLHHALTDEMIDMDEARMIRALEGVVGVSSEERQKAIAKARSLVHAGKHHNLDERLSHLFGIQE